MWLVLSAMLEGTCRAMARMYMSYYCDMSRNPSMNANTQQIPFPIHLLWPSCLQSAAISEDDLRQLALNKPYLF